jgi:hypothetical protein
VLARGEPIARRGSALATLGAIGGPGSDFIAAQSEQKGLGRALRRAACGAHSTI